MIIECCSFPKTLGTSSFGRKVSSVRWSPFTSPTNTQKRHGKRKSPSLTLLPLTTIRHAKVLVLLVLCYALSPIDLIPDFIPVLGYLDDIIIVPVGIWLARKLIPETTWLKCAEVAAANELTKQSLPKNYWTAALIVLLYAVGLSYCVRWWLFG